MPQSQIETTGESGRTRPNAQENEVASVNSLDISVHESAPSVAPTMGSDEARSDAVQSLENAENSTVWSTVENESSLGEHRRQPLSLSLDTSCSVLDEQLAKSSLAMQSPPSAGAGPLTRPQSPRARTRNRGYSLRRSLFSNNTQSQPGSDGAIMEMESSEPSSGRQLSGAAASKDEKGQPSVTMSAFMEDEDSSIPPEPTQYGDTLVKRQFAYGRSSLLQPRKELLQKLRGSYQKVKRVLMRMNEIPPTADGRHINLDFSDPSIPIDERTGVPYVNNVIRSSRYTLLNFFPRQLLAQFSKLANFYFLIVSILQMIPGLSTTGTYTTIIPLLIFVGISMAKEGYDDIRRWRLDREENNRDALILDREWHSNRQDETQWKSTKWHDVKVGDVLLLKRNDPVPADLTLLHVDDPSSATYIEVCKFLPINSKSLVD
jgi:phospholipid-translocating ATPase